jgi:hypothetical protein
MADFVLVDSDYERIPGLLRESVRGFKDSPEYELLAGSEREVPGLVCAAFTRFLTRFQEEELRTSLSSADARTLDDCYEAIGMLTALPGSRVRTLVEDEIFENVGGDDELWRSIRAHLGSTAIEVLLKWEAKHIK